MARRRIALLGSLVAVLTSCVSIAREAPPSGEKTSGEKPTRFTIRPDDYHVPYAGTAGDGRKFFLSSELFGFGTPGEEGPSFVGVFLWNADGSFSEVKVDRIADNEDELVAERLRELGEYKLEPITVAPFSKTIDGVRFGWIAEKFEGTYDVHIEPGDFIAYYEPWDGFGYDT